ncbi:MAG TPA: hypothetical protein VN789_12140 [Casimicrobiaceae bacterium]|nr:hypothetical protein [Casimicrobiaceae bacterium]
MKRAKLHPPIAPRNPVARSPLMRKGGAHGPSEPALRRRAKVALKRQLRDPATFE